jgi:hypothetical protein
MATVGYDRECIQVYASVHKPAVDSTLCRLGVEIFSIGDDWDVLEAKIRRWIHAARAAVCVTRALSALRCGLPLLRLSLLPDLLELLLLVVFLLRRHHGRGAPTLLAAGDGISEGVIVLDVTVAGVAESAVAREAVGETGGGNMVNEVVGSWS